MSRLEKIVILVTRWLNWIAAVTLIVVMGIVCANVVGRSFWGAPVKGTVDIVSLLGAIIVGWAIAYTQVLKGHIRIDLLVQRLPPRIQYIIDSVIDLAGLALFALISWQTVIFAKANFEVGELSEVLKLPITPFASVVAVGCIALTFVLFIDLIKSVSKAVGK
jgi:TRAP-type C4-dicarboxylate transport system permease small subunit